MWPDPEMMNRPGSRFTDRIELVASHRELFVDGPDEDDTDWDAVHSAVSEIESEIASPAEVKSFFTSGGRGASGPAIGFELLGVVATVGGVLATGEMVLRAIKVLRRRFGQGVTLSHGALKALAVFDVLKRRPDLSDDQVSVVGCSEVLHSPIPSETGHTGVDMTTIVVGRSDNSESWCYLVQPDGKILHFSEGGPIPPSVLLHLGGHNIPLGIDLELPNYPTLGETT